MKIDFITHGSCEDVLHFSGVTYFFSQALKEEHDVFCIDNLTQENKIPSVLLDQMKFYKKMKQNYLPKKHPSVLNAIAREIEKKIRSQSDFLFSQQSSAIGFVDTNKPFVFYEDKTFASLIDYYPSHSRLCEESLRHGHDIEQRRIDKAKVIFYSSQWSADSAIKTYSANPSKVHVIPFGANVINPPSAMKIAETRKKLKSSPLQLLFVGKNFIRKGADLAIEVAKKINDMGLPCLLNMVGLDKVPNNLASFVKVYPYLNKANSRDLAIYEQLVLNSHYLLLPSRAECTPMIIAEVNAFGLPVIAADVGGIKTLIKENVNGKVYHSEEYIEKASQYLLAEYTNIKDYQSFSASSRELYDSELNWERCRSKLDKIVRDSM